MPSSEDDWLALAGALALIAAAALVILAIYLERVRWASSL
jgi:hypothetical protein